MKKSIYIQIFVFAIIIALMGSFNNYGQDSRSKFIRPNEQNRISNEILSNFQGDSKVVPNYKPNNLQTVLYDQTAGTTTSGIASQDFEVVNDGFDCQAADNFTVPSGGWSVNQVVVGGFYNTTGPSAGFNVYFYQNNAGVPGTQVYSALSQPYSFDGTYFTISLGSAAALTAGDYWISVQSRMDFGTGGQWYWFTSTGTFGSIAHWQNPNGGFGTCPTWEPITICNASIDTEMSFALVDAPPVTATLPVIEDFESGIFPPLNWTQSGVIWTNDNTVSGYGNGTWSAVANFYSVSSGSDDLVTVEYNSTGAANPTLFFDWAYATYIDDPDELDIYYSTDAGATWTILLAMPGGLNGILNPFHLATTSPYFPLDSEWSTMSLALPANTNRVKFTAVTAFGNLCWLDNIKITGELFVDGFENPPYTFPGQVACLNPTNWSTWTATPCGADDATISTNYAFTGTQSALIDFASPRWVDLIKPLGNKTTGKWYISFFTYIPTGKTGYFNTLAVLPTPTADWAMECYFNAGGGGQLTNVPGAPINFTWTADTWNQVMVVVDFNATPTTAEFWFGKVGQLAQLYSWDWTQGGTITDQLGGNDFFAPTGTSVDEMYIDDYYFSDAPPPIQQLADDVGSFSIDMAYQYGPGAITPMATVKNYGTAAQTFDVQMTITGGYTSTKTVTNLAAGTTTQVTFDNWNATTAGSYTVDIQTQLIGDLNSDNDDLSQGVHIWDDSGDWTSGADYPITTYNGVGVSYNDGTTNWLFVLGGNTTSTLGTECYKYNVTTNTWTSIAPLPAKRLIHAGAVVGNFIYAIGGSDGTVYANTTFKYDIVANTWSTVAPVPTNIGWCKALGYLDNYIYLAGGYDGVANYLSSIYLYNVTTDTWSSATSMPLAVFGGGFGITGNKLVYAAGAYETGISNTVMVGTIDGGNPAVISWTTMDNTYPGIGNEITGDQGASLVSEMLSQFTGSANNHSPDAVVWPAGAIYRTHAHTWGSDAIIMAGGTPTATYSAADPGPCYIYKPATDTWIAQENVPVPIGAHQSGTFNDGSTWKYIIASGFGVSAPEVATQIYTQTLGGGSTFALSVNVANGWNMVSVPGTNPAGMTPVDWWANLEGSVFKYSGGYIPITTTAPTEGYWLKNNGAGTYSYPAIQIVTHTNINAAAGWNLIGGYENTVPTASLTTTPPGLLQLPIYEYSGGYNVATNIVPGYGYWAKMSSAGAINAPPLAKGSGEVAEYFNEDWGKIILTDATGINYTLYAVKGEVNLDNYELPPAPPEGMFDIRFGSGRIAEDLNSAIQTIEMSGVTYPLTVSVQGMDIRLQDESGRTLNVNLKAGEDVVISDATIQKLMVSGELVPAEYALEQNYPNPFNPSTVIEFSLPENVGNVQLSIYNTLGEKVAELVNTAMVAGKYSYQWNAQNVATGMYIYELRTDKFVSVKKMLLLK